MFGHRFFGARYFAARYFGPAAEAEEAEQAPFSGIANWPPLPRRKWRKGRENDEAILIHLLH